MQLADGLRENVALAIDALRVSRLRSSLTILGVVIGVATVMTMATIVQGIREQIVHTIEIAGPTTFYVVKVFSQTPINPDRVPKYIRIRPDLRVAEAERIAALPQIQYAGIWSQFFGRIEFEGARTQLMTAFGADDRYQEIQGGELTDGRWFTKAELAAGAPVIVLSQKVVDRIFGRIRAVDHLVHFSGRPLRVIGVWQEPGNIFAPPGQEVGAIVPFLTSDHQFTIDKVNGLFISVKPKPGIQVSDAEEAVMLELRTMRGLRPAEPNTFDFITQDQILDTVNNLTGMFFLVMIALSSVALMVGGIGVMAIMMVSVTDRTREIGVRKALGATRRDIMLQFLVEAATLTGIGGAAGILVGLVFGRLVTAAMNIDASTPIPLTLIAVAVSVSIGLIFGLLPANRAARLDPIEALRYE